MVDNETWRGLGGRGREVLLRDRTKWGRVLRCMKEGEIGGWKNDRGNGEGEISKVGRKESWRKIWLP